MLNLMVYLLEAIMTDNGFDVLAATHILLVFALMLMTAIAYDWYRRNRN